MPGYAGPDQDPGGRPDHEAAHTPRWVKVFGMITLVLVVMFVVLHLTVGGPGSHTAP
jgi:hypothetical protein